MQQAQRNQAVAAVAKTNEIEEPPVSFRSIEDLQQSGINVRYHIYICYVYYAFILHCCIMYGYNN
jgi:ribosomal protein S26